MRSLTSLALSAALLVMTGRASAEDRSPSPPRLRMGVIFEGGPVLTPTPALGTFGIAGTQVILGAQLSEMVAVYAVGNIDFVLGERGGGLKGGALLADFAVNDAIFLGAGPEVQHLEAFARSGPLHGGKGFLPGGRLRFTWLSGLLSSNRPGQRAGMAFGVDVHLLARVDALFPLFEGAELSAFPASIVIVPALTAGLATF